MLFYRHLHDLIPAGETISFSVFPPVPSPRAILFGFHLPHKDKYLRIWFAGKLVVDLNTTKAYDFPFALPLNLILDAKRNIYCQIENTSVSAEETFITFAWNTLFS